MYAAYERAAHGLYTVFSLPVILQGFPVYLDGALYRRPRQVQAVILAYVRRRLAAQLYKLVHGLAIRLDIDFGAVSLNIDLHRAQTGVYGLLLRSDPRGMGRRHPHGAVVFQPHKRSTRNPAATMFLCSVASISS